MRAAVAALVLVPLLIAVDVASDPDGGVQAAPLGIELRLPTEGPLGPVTVIGDSVLMGSGLWGSIQPTLPDRLVEQGWGPIRFRATVGLRAGPVGSSSTSAGWRIQNWRAGGWDPVDVLVNLGANDSGICRTNVACGRQRIEQLLDTIGPGHRIWWPKITQTPSQAAWATAWNSALDQVAAARADVYTWDWPTEMATGGYSSTDNIHLSVASYGKRSRRMAEVFTFDLAVRDFVVSSGGRLGGVSVVGDSVLRGSGGPGVSLAGRLVERGWGTVRFRAAAGMVAGGVGGVDSAASWVREWRAGGWDPPNVLVNLGVNDVEVCRLDAVCARERIVGLLDEIGVGRRVWWPQITHGESGWAATWNAVLVEVAGERADVFTWDWPAEMAGAGYASGDGVHLTVAGYQQRSVAVAEAFTHDLTRAVRVGGDAVLPSPTAGPSTYVPLAPVRVVDTRPVGARADGSVLAVDFGGLLPVGATAVAINVTATRASVAGYLAAGPCGTAIGASTVNFTAGADRAAMTVSPLGVGGDVCVFNSGETDIVVDLQGVFVEEGGSRLSPLPVQERVADTRPVGLLTETLVVETPPGATAVAVNLTVDHAVGAGFLTAAPCGAATGVSNVNFGGSEAVAGAAFVATSVEGTICVETSVAADVIVDLTGVFGVEGLSFVPVTPTRMLDTRNRIGGWAPIHGDGQVLDVAVAPAGAEAVTGTLTEVEPISSGYLTAFGCPTRPGTSSVNARYGQVMANSLTTAVSDTGRLCVYADPTTHTLFDVTGWWTT